MTETNEVHLRQWWEKTFLMWVGEEMPFGPSYLPKLLAKDGPTIYREIIEEDANPTDILIAERHMDKLREDPSVFRGYLQRMGDSPGTEAVFDALLTTSFLFADDDTKAAYLAHILWIAIELQFAKDDRAARRIFMSRRSALVSMWPVEITSQIWSTEARSEYAPEVL